MQASLVRVLLPLAIVLTTAAGRPPADLAQSPPMGWNSWNWFGKKSINENVVREVMDAMASTGLRDAGYHYVVVDGGWRDVQLGPDGKLYSHPERFPHGMKVLADYAHARGLKFGVHLTPGTNDCGGDPVGTYGHEEVNMKQFVEWGLDFLKIDRCKNDNGWTEDATKAVYFKWSDLIGKSARPMVYSISAYEYRDWYPAYCHMARTTYDITARVNGGAIFDDGRKINQSYLSVMGVVEFTNAAAGPAGHGYWNDPDMLVTGEQGLNHDEQQSHFALWCIMSAPLMLGNDPRQMTPKEKSLITNREAIAINQDPTEQGRRIKQADGGEVWLKHLKDGRVAVLLLNRDAEEARNITFTRADGGPAGQWAVRGVFAQKDLGRFDGTITLRTPPHGCRLLIVSSAPAK